MSLWTGEVISGTPQRGWRLVSPIPLQCASSDGGLTYVLLNGADVGIDDSKLVVRVTLERDMSCETLVAELRAACHCSGSNDAKVSVQGTINAMMWTINAVVSLRYAGSEDPLHKEELNFCRGVLYRCAQCVGVGGRNPTKPVAVA